METMRKQHNPKLDPEFTCSIDAVDENEWNGIIAMFRDATLNQTWSFGATISGKVKLSHLLLKKNDDIVTACQIRLKTLASSMLGVAYVACGPMWRLRSKENDLENFRQAVRALRIEYAHHRGLFLIIKPNIYDCDPDADAAVAVFQSEDFQCSKSSNRTLMIDLNRPLEELRKGLHQKWRNQLNCAERNNLQIYDGCDDDLFEKFKKIYVEMYSRKNYAYAVDIDNFGRICSMLPEVLKPRVVICQSNGQLMAGAVVSTVGDTGFYFLGATSNSGMKTKASNLVQWRVIQWLKEHGYRDYDLGGISPQTTPETYHFKAGICGKNANNGKDTTRIGEFTACESRLSSFAIKNALSLRHAFQKLKLRNATVSGGILALVNH
jgi:lipid II:glycine glycyltransferase (peptidoglycan interpeptide bridge formation enzyme)